MKPASDQTISLRKFPYPYKAMFAISSDVDHAVSLPAYLEFMSFLNTTRDTCYGVGLGLEISNSFWFFNAEDQQQISYFQGTSTKESDFAPVCRELWASGHLDTLHSYGNFNRGGFERSHAEKALKELDQHKAKILVWVNHGNDENHQKLGNYPAFHGAKTNEKAYHFDLLKESGTRFFWAGRTTHVCGQNAAFSPGNRIQQLAQNLIVQTKYRHVDRPLPSVDNQLLIKTQLEDGNQILEFQRFISCFGEVKNTDVTDLALQLTRPTLAALVKSQGYMLLYTHMNENLPEGQPLPADVARGFDLLAAFARNKDLLVTTSARLLQYADLTTNLLLDIHSGADLTEVHLHARGNDHLTVNDLQGLTFYCSDPEKTRIYWGGQLLETQVNPADHRGRVSISLPWTALVFPL